MSGFIKGEDRFQATLFPESLDDYVAEDSAVRVIVAHEAAQEQTKLANVSGPFLTQW